MSNTIKVKVTKEELEEYQKYKDIPCPKCQNQMGVSKNNIQGSWKVYKLLWFCPNKECSQHKIAKTGNELYNSDPQSVKDWEESDMEELI